MRFQHQFRMLGSAWARAAAEERAEEPAEQLAEDDSKPSTPFSKPEFIVHSDKVVQTLNFEAAYLLYSRNALTDEGEPAPWSNDWCGNRLRHKFDEYAGLGRRRFLVMPYGPDATRRLTSSSGDAVDVPVAKVVFTISLDAAGNVKNINDKDNNYYKYDFDFDLSGARDSIEALRAVVPVKPWEGETGGIDIGWEGVHHPEVWADAGFDSAEARDYMQTEAYSDLVGSRRYNPELVDLQGFVRTFKRHNRSGLNSVDLDICYRLGLEPDEYISVRRKGFDAEELKAWNEYYIGGDSAPVDLWVEMRDLGLKPQHIDIARDITQIRAYHGAAYRDPETLAAAVRVAVALGDTWETVFEPTNYDVASVVDWLAADLPRRAAWVQRTNPDYDVIHDLWQLSVAPRQDLDEYLSVLAEAGLSLSEAAENPEFQGASTVKALRKLLQERGHAIKVPKSRLQQLLDAAGVVDGKLNGETVPQFASVPELVAWLRERGAISKRTAALFTFRGSR